MIASLRKAAIHGGFGAGVGAAIAMMLVMAVLRFISNTASIPELMEESLIRLTGGKVESFFINNLGVGGKALLLTSIAEGTLLLGGLLGLGFTHLWLKAVGFRLPKNASGLLYGLLAGLLLNAVFLPLVNQGFFGSEAVGVTAPTNISQSLYGSALAPWGLPVWLNMFLLTGVFGLALTALLRWPVAASAGSPAAVSEQSVETQGRPYSRRDLNRAMGGGALALLGGAGLWFAIRRGLEPPSDAALQEIDLSQQPTPNTSANAGATPDASMTPVTADNGKHQIEEKPTAGMQETPPTPPVPPGFENVKAVLPPAVTPVDSFYITTKNFIDPTVDGNSWQLNFKGMVDAPYSITLKDLMALPALERVETLACISNPVGGNLVSNGNWKGVNFIDLLNRAKPQAGVKDVIVHGADGYADSFPIDVATKNDLFLAYEMNGKPLTTKHGYPARLLVPNIFGMKNCKWITDIELVNYDFKGYWESQGWDDVAVYKTISRIDYPNSGNIPAKPIYVGGVAFAGNRGIKKVELSTDGGKSWNDAQVRIVPGKYTWVLWTYPWNPKPGNYTLQVRATDGTGAAQISDQADTYPDGATGYHTRGVQVG